MGWKDQKALCSGLMTYAIALVAGWGALPSTGQGAPIFTQAVRSAISWSFNLPPSGIFSRSSVWLTARMRRLCSGLPGTMAGPDLPPLSKFSRESSCSPPICELVWQAKQLFASTGRMRVSKNSNGSFWGAALKTGTDESRQQPNNTGEIMERRTSIFL